MSNIDERVKMALAIVLACAIDWWVFLTIEGIPTGGEMKLYLPNLAFFLLLASMKIPLSKHTVLLSVALLVPNFLYRQFLIQGSDSPAFLLVMAILSSLVFMAPMLLVLLMRKVRFSR